MNREETTDRTADEPRTNFGYARVPEADRQGMVNQVFSKVAERYDLMNDLMSGGLHRLWKNDLVNWLAPPAGERDYHLLDVAGGTGDIALRVIEAAGSRARATICDISGQMLRVGRQRVKAEGHVSAIEFVQGNAETLPFPDRHFDACTIGFGIRNVTRIDRALAQAFRVLKPGGRFLCLEFSEVQVPILDRLYDAWSVNAIPVLGQLAAGDRESYKYLVESIRRFPDQETFAAMLETAGFEQVTYRNLTGGIAAIHSGWRI